jgi:hypothetical protein
MRDSFNIEIDQMRKLWGIPKGVTIMLFGRFGIPIGMGVTTRQPDNDNEAKS